MPAASGWSPGWPALFPLAGLVVTLALGALVRARQGGAALPRSLAALNLAVALWNLDVLLLFTAPDGETAELIDRLFQAPIIALPCIALLFFFVFLGRRLTDPLLVGFGAWGALLVAASAGPHYFTGWRRLWFGWYGVPGPLYVFFVAYLLVYLGLSTALLAREARATRDHLRRTQAQYLLAANLLLGPREPHELPAALGGGVPAARQRRLGRLRGPHGDHDHPPPPARGAGALPRRHALLAADHPAHRRLLPAPARDAALAPAGGLRRVAPAADGPGARRRLRGRAAQGLAPGAARPHLLPLARPDARPPRGVLRRAPAAASARRSSGRRRGRRGGATRTPRAAWSCATRTAASRRSRGPARGRGRGCGCRRGAARRPPRGTRRLPRGRPVRGRGPGRRARRAPRRLPARAEGRRRAVEGRGPGVPRRDRRAWPRSRSSRRACASASAARSASPPSGAWPGSSRTSCATR